MHFLCFYKTKAMFVAHPYCWYIFWLYFKDVKCLDSVLWDRPSWECARVVNSLSWECSIITKTSSQVILNYNHLNDISFLPPETTVIRSALGKRRQIGEADEETQHTDIVLVGLWCRKSFYIQMIIFNVFTSKYVW